MSATALEAIGVSKRYGDHHALVSVSMRASHGRLHGLLGPNGAGKTTLMRVLLGLVRPDSGSVSLLGCATSSVAGPLPGGVAGFVETPAFYPYLTGRQNLSLLGRLDGGDRRDLAGRVTRVIDQVGLLARADAPVRGYSAGMRQRLGLASALLRSPQLLFLDEPTSSLDPAAARDVRALATDIADAGAAVVLSSHDMAEVDELCTTLTVIDRGHVVFDGDTADLKRRAPSTIHVMRTSDNAAAMAIARERHDMKAISAADECLEIAGTTDALDAYVIALGSGGVAVRALERRTRSLESLFLELTGDGRTPAQSAVAHRSQESQAVVMTS